jgi:uncharacterized protein
MHPASYAGLLKLRPRKGLATARANTVFDVDYAALEKAGVTMLIFDVDDTLCGHHDPVPVASMDFLKGLAKRFRIAIVSNCSKKRRTYLEKTFKPVPAFVAAVSSKPSAEGFLLALRDAGAPASAAAVVGDRVGMDLLGAKNAGIRHRVLVEPYSYVKSGRRAPPPYRMLRALEKKFFA